MSKYENMAVDESVPYWTARPASSNEEEEEGWQIPWEEMKVGEKRWAKEQDITDRYTYKGSKKERIALKDGAIVTDKEIKENNFPISRDEDGIFKRTIINPDGTKK